MKVQVNERHVSPFAGASLALELVQRLQMDGWPAVEYTDRAAVWEFDSVRQMFDFEKSFDIARRDIMPAPYRWRVVFPCDCWRVFGHPTPCNCGEPDGFVHETMTELHEFDIAAAGMAGMESKDDVK